MRERYFTKKKLIMFIFFIVQFANIAFGLALAPEFYVLNSEQLSILLMLTVLYIDPFEQRRMLVPIILAFHMGSIIWNYIQIPSSMLTWYALFTLFYLVGAFFFGKNMFKDNFDSPIENLIITMTIGLYLGYQLYLVFPTIISIFSYQVWFLIPYVTFYLGLIVVPGAIIAYTWLRRYRIE